MGEGSAAHQVRFNEAQSYSRCDTITFARRPSPTLIVVLIAEIARQKRFKKRVEINEPFYINDVRSVREYPHASTIDGTAQ